MKRTLLMFGMIGIMAAAVGCGNDPDPLNVDTARFTESGTFWIMYNPSVDPVPHAQDFDLTVMIHDSDKTTMLMSATVDAVNVEMPAHGHGMPQEPTITDNGNGTHTISPMHFQMHGHWTIQVHATNATDHDHVTFNVVVGDEEPH